ncbi:hypothetical protein ElyMa_003344900 [Elysia marginata]|uniref:Uncharacterized protein n=1 Tax=Elysia marginata TaxID=1093978 RepID=A0AAV4JFZ1_9GAST|nr:hypothetical protein ElyMa_003344900 [Elysia marginata]
MLNHVFFHAQLPQVPNVTLITLQSIAKYGVSGEKQICVQVPTLFGIYFSLLYYAFHGSEDGIFLHSRSDGNHSTYRVSEQRQRHIECSSEICSLQTMPPSPHTPRKPFSDSSHALRTSSPSPSA